MYDFDTPTDRRGTDSYKWDSKTPSGDNPDGIIPMWVADMDFRTAPCIIEALQKRVEHGIFGYTSVPESYYQSVMNWFRRRHGWKIDRDWILYTSGVVPAISATIKALTEPGDKVIAMTPVYNCFFSSIRNNGCVLSDCRLLYDPDAERTYSIDFDDLEKRCKDAKLLLLCNPHNPAGRVWTKEELSKIGEICRKYGVIVVSDEIHCEIVMRGFKFTPFAAASQENQHCCITLNSPSKSFNTAGLQIANIISDNPQWRAKIDKAININEVCDVNPFGVIALQAAYNEGEQWLLELNGHIQSNYRYASEALSKTGFPITKMEGTYLMWLDVSSLCMKSSEIEESLVEHEKVWINAGEMYGAEGFIRINLACPRPTLEEGLRRIVKGLERLKES